MVFGARYLARTKKPKKSEVKANSRQGCLYPCKPEIEFGNPACDQGQAAGEGAPTPSRAKNRALGDPGAWGNTGKGACATHWAWDWVWVWVDLGWPKRGPLGGPWVAQASPKGRIEEMLCLQQKAGKRPGWGAKSIAGIADRVYRGNARTLIAADLR